MAHHHRHHKEEEEGYGGEYAPQYAGDNSAPYFPPVNPSYEQSPYANPPAEAYGRETYSYQQQDYSRNQSDYPNYERVNQDYSRNQSDYPNYEQEIKTEKRREHFAEAAALGSGAFALYERHEEKVDPENARVHKIEEEVAEAVAAGSGGYTLYEHHQVRKTEHREEEAEGKKHHHHLF